MDLAVRNRAYWTERAPSYTVDVKTNIAPRRPRNVAQRPG